MCGKCDKCGNDLRLIEAIAKSNQKTLEMTKEISRKTTRDLKITFWLFVICIPLTIFFSKYVPCKLALGV